MTIQFNLSCKIIDPKYDLSNFNFKNLLSIVETITCIINKILQAVHIYLEKNLIF